MARFNIKVNGEVRVVDADPDTPVLYVLRAWEAEGVRSPAFKA